LFALSASFSRTGAVKRAIFDLFHSGKKELPHYASTAQLLSVVRQYTETSQQCKMETTKIVSSMQLYSQTNTSPDSPRQQLTMTGVAQVDEIENGLHRVARLQSIKRVSPASPASPASPDVFSITARQCYRLGCLSHDEKQASDVETNPSQPKP